MNVFDCEQDRRRERRLDVGETPRVGDGRPQDLGQMLLLLMSQETDLSNHVYPCRSFVEPLMARIFGRNRGK